MADVFLSYRTDDAQTEARLLYRELTACLGGERVFWDDARLQPGTQFPQALQDEVDQCQLMVVLVGANWVTAADDAGNLRLHQPGDWVRREVATALRRKITVLPVLLGNTPDLHHKQDKLPADLHPLCDLQYQRVSTGKDFDDDLKVVVDLAATAVRRAEERGGGAGATAGPYWHTVSLASEAEHWLKFQRSAEKYFSEHGVAPSPVLPFVDVGPLSGTDWEQLLARAVRSLRRVEEQVGAVHLCPYAYSLFCFGLGSRVLGQWEGELYQYGPNLDQQWGIWPVGPLNQRVKFKIAPLDYEYQTIAYSESQSHRGKDPKRVAVVLDVATETVSQGFESHCTTSPDFGDVTSHVWRRDVPFNVEDPSEWENGACDLARAVRDAAEGNSKEVYLFAAAANSLMLLAGSGIGSDTHVHLMQYDGTTREYRDMCTLGRK